MLVLIVAVGVLVLGGGIALVVREASELPPPDVLGAIAEAEIEHPEHPGPHLEDEEGARPPRPRSSAPKPSRAGSSGCGPGSRGRRARSARACSPRSAARTYAAWEELEDTLLAADVGIGPTTELVDALRSRVRVEGIHDPERAKAVLRDELSGWWAPISTARCPPREATANQASCSWSA